ncbi:DUF3892 domain-containing protein [Leptonema illini]|uniref:DUF3892 domain-containing protein n=1 Tax=Leptonema illini DSM 21528 TaxID=929563 RepID=H2CA15_9LEPT|nr:hypothetical protein Lepil_0433 [Leptonema illini DSM 21528]
MPVIPPWSRKVTHVERDAEKRTKALCMKEQGLRVVAAVAIQEIQQNGHPQSQCSPYYTDVGGVKAAVIVVLRDGKPYLRTDPDKTTRNNLDVLPDC